MTTTTETMSPTYMELETSLREVLRLAQRARAKEIDAGACGTRYDFKAMHDAQEAADDAVSAFLSQWSKRVRS